MYSLNKIFKIKNIVAGISIAGIALGMLSTNAFAADFLSNEDVTTDKTYSNLYVAGNSIKINNDIEKDLTGAGETIEVNSNVERNATLAANKIVISESSTIGANFKGAANKITISGTIEEDVIVAAERVIIQDATILGDIVVASGRLEINNSNIGGDAYLSVGEKSDNWDDQIAGDINIGDDVDVKIDAPDFSGFAIFASIVSFIMSILTLLVVVVFLSKRNRLYIPSLVAGKTVLKDFAWGLISFVAGFVAVVLSLFLFKITVPFVMIIIAVGLFSGVFTPIYLANQLKNTNSKNILWYVIGAWALLIVLGFLSWIPIIGWIIGLILGLLTITVYGYLLRSLFVVLNSSLSKIEMVNQEDIPKEM